MFNFKIWAIFKLLDGYGLKFVALVIVTTLSRPSADSAARTGAALCVRNMELLSQIAAHCTLLRSMSKQQNYYTFQNNRVFEQNYTTSLFLSTFSTTNLFCLCQFYFVLFFENDIVETSFYYLLSMIIYSVVKSPRITNISFYKKL